MRSLPKTSAEKSLAEVKGRLELLSKEVDKIKKDAKTKGLREKEQIVRDAGQEAERLKRMATQEIERHSLTRMRYLKEYAADLAVKVARKRIEERITEDDQSYLIDKSINRLEKLHEKTDSDQEIRPRSH